MFETISALAARGEAYVPTTVFWQLQQDGTLNRLSDLAPAAGGDGDPAYWLRWLTTLANDSPGAAGVSYFADQVHAIAVKRRLVSLYAELSEQIVSPETPRSLIETAMQRLAALGNAEAQARQPRSLAQLIVDDAEAFERFLDAPAELAGWRSGFAALDEAIDGFEPGRLVVFAARTGVGKTLFAEQVAAGLAKPHGDAPGQAVFFTSLEMTGEQLKRRLQWSQAGLGRAALRRQGFATPDQRRQFFLADQRLRLLPITVDDRSGRNWRTVIARMEQAIVRDGARVIVLDHVDLVSQPRTGKQANRHAEVSEIMADCKALAQSQDVCVLVLSQVNRQATGREGGLPSIADLRESGSKEEDADTVCILNRPALAEPNLPPDSGRWHELDVHIVKHRDGSTGTVRLWVDLPTQRIGEWAG